VAVYYTDADALRDRLGVDDTALPDAAAEDLIAHAEILIDSVMGPAVVDATTGRKIVESEVDAWRWQCVTDAACILAASIHTDKDRYDTGSPYDSVTGPDFAVSGRSSTGGLSELLGARVMGLLNHSGLRVMTVWADACDTPSERRF